MGQCYWWVSSSYLTKPANNGPQGTTVPYIIISVGSHPWVKSISSVQDIDPWRQYSARVFFSLVVTGCIKSRSLSLSNSNYSRTVMLIGEIWTLQNNEFYDLLAAHGKSTIFLCWLLSLQANHILLTVQLVQWNRGNL